MANADATGHSSAESRHDATQVATTQVEQLPDTVAAVSTLPAGAERADIPTAETDDEKTPETLPVSGPNTIVAEAADATQALSGNPEQKPVVTAMMGTADAPAAENRQQGAVEVPALNTADTIRPAPVAEPTTSSISKPPTSVRERIAPVASTDDIQPVALTGLLTGVGFRAGTDTLESQSTLALDRLAQSLKAQPTARVEIRTHTDASVSPHEAMILTRKRALSVARYLVRAGVSKSQLAARAFGSNVPLEQNNTAAGRRQNNRVELQQIQ